MDKVSSFCIFFDTHFFSLFSKEPFAKLEKRRKGLEVKHYHKTKKEFWLLIILSDRIVAAKQLSLRHRGNK